MENFGIRKEKGNKGFSLLEILVAIAVLAVVITPVLNSFITSASVNKKAREVMAATDVAQSVIEGLKGRTYDEISSALEASASGMPSGSRFTTVLDNYYNTSGNCISVNGVTSGAGTVLDSMVTSKVSNPALLGSGTAQQYKVNSQLYVTATNTVGTSGSKKLIWHQNEYASFLVYQGVSIQNYSFDVVVSILPAAMNNADIFYPYSVVVSVYKQPKSGAYADTDILNGNVLPVMVLDTGIRNKDGR